MDDIEREKHPYNPINRNSNGTVDETLKRSGLPEPEQDDPGENYSPGSGGLTPSIPPSVSDDFTAAQETPQRCDPLTFDLDGDGLETIGIDPNNPILFDHDGDSIKTATGWIAPDDAFLVLDRNGNGTIDSGRELFGDSTPIIDAEGNTRNAVDGFDALAAQDTNADGKVDSQDTNFSNLRLWRDLNQNGISEANELFTPTDAGIASITVAKTENSILLPNGNVIADLGGYTRTDGSAGELGTTGDLGDVDLRENTFFSRCAPGRAKRRRVVRDSRASRGVEPLWAGGVRRTAGRSRPAEQINAPCPSAREGLGSPVAYIEGRRTRQFTDTIPLTTEAQALPSMHGSGQVRGWQRMQRISHQIRHAA